MSNTQAILILQNGSQEQETQTKFHANLQNNKAQGPCENTSTAARKLRPQTLRALVSAVAIQFGQHIFHDTISNAMNRFFVNLLETHVLHSFCVVATQMTSAGQLASQP
jgi:hypothetical protein